MEGITVDGGGGLSVGAGEEKVRGGVLVLQLAAEPSAISADGWLLAMAGHATHAPGAPASPAQK